MSDEQDELRELLKNPGWLRFVAAQDAYWTDSLSKLIASAANDEDDQMALQKIRQVIAAQRAWFMAKAWPTERLRAIANATERPQPVLSRGGF